MEASIIDCEQVIDNGTLYLNNLTISVLSNSQVVRLALFIQTNDSNNTIYRFNMPIEILSDIIRPRIRCEINLSDYIDRFNIMIRNSSTEPLKYQVYIRNISNEQGYISCPLLEGVYDRIHL